MERIIRWLLNGDISIQYMTHYYLMKSDKTILSQLQNRIAEEGFGARFLSCRNENGHWGIFYYQPKWTSTHYTLLDLKNLYVPDTLKQCRDIVKRMFNECMNDDGGINLCKSKHDSDVCVDGMILNYASYFCSDESRITKLVDCILSAQKPTGGFSWYSEEGDPHSTICVLEGLAEYYKSGLQYKLRDVESSQAKAVEFLLANRLFIENADKRFQKFSYPYRYRYDLLRALEYFASQELLFDDRMQSALDWLQRKRKKDGLWYLENQHKGNVHFSMEEVNAPSRFITLKALRILQVY